MTIVSLGDVKNTKRFLRTQTITTILNEFDEKIMQLKEEDREAKYRKMAESPFRFYRGSAYLFYFDISRIPFSYHTPANRPIWIQGDLHFENFGVFQNEQGKLVYDVNDFDEGYVGSYLVDVLRMIASIALVCTEKEWDSSVKKEAINTYLSSYYKQLKRFRKGKDDPFTFMCTEKNTKGPVERVLKKMRKKQAMTLLEEYTSLAENQRYFPKTEEIVPITDAEKQKLVTVWKEYIQTIDEGDRKKADFYHVKDIALKYGTGTASIGLKRYYLLIEGKDDTHENDIILEAKEVRTAIPAYFMPFHESFWEMYHHQGKRVVETQKAMHHFEDPYLGYFTMDHTEFYVRERSPYKKKVKLTKIETTEDLYDTLEIMGKVTAKIHARADQDIDSNIITHHSEESILTAIGDDFDSFAKQLIDWALFYEEQVQTDYQIFLEWNEKRKA